MKRRMVEGLKMEGKPLKIALEAVGMAKSSYYYQPVRKRRPRALDEALVKSINLPTKDMPEESVSTLVGRRVYKGQRC